MYSDLCGAEQMLENNNLEKSKLQRDVDALIRDLAQRDRDLAH
jgi:hypothetical protein